MRINPVFEKKEALPVWPIDWAGNIAISGEDLLLLTSAASLQVPSFLNTEEAVAWGSRLSAPEHSMLVGLQRTCCMSARNERDLQRMVNLATQSQLLREAAQAFVPDLTGAPDRQEKECL